jgi:hypothetical protein
MASDRWNGKLGYQYDRFLTSFGDFRAKEDDLTAKHNGFLEANYNLSQGLKVRPVLRYLSLEHSESDRRASDEIQKQIGLAGLLRTLPGTFVGVEGLFIAGNYPNRDFTSGSLIDDGYKQERANLLVEWAFWGKSQLNTQFGYTRREQNHLSDRNLGEPTWRIELDWQATAKTALNFELWRDIASVDNRSSSFSVNNVIAVGSVWKPTAKLTLEAKAKHEQRDFKQNVGTAIDVSKAREDKDYLLSLDVSYELLRKITFTIGSETANRNSNIDELDYRYWTVNSELKIEF